MPEKRRILGILVLAALGAASAARTQEAPTSESVEAKIRRIESSLIPTLHIKGRPVVSADMAARMTQFNVPAVSVAVARDGKIEWARAYGFGDVEAKSPATPETLFQAASISKPVAAAVTIPLDRPAPSPAT
jgi:CubicO group peptidase (beta-lactamase class C family)